MIHVITKFEHPSKKAIKKAELLKSGKTSVELNQLDETFKALGLKEG